MANEKPKHVRSTKNEIAATFLIVLSLSFMLSCVGMFFPLQILFFTLLGWLTFLNDVLPQMRVSVPAIAFALMLIAVMVAVIQLLGVFAFRRLQPQSEGTTPRSWRFRWTCSILVLLVISFSGGLAVVGVAHQSARLRGDKGEFLDRSGLNIAQRMELSQHLKQIGTAMHNYHEMHSEFPAGGTFNQAGQPQHSWATSLLPFLDQEALYNQIDFQQPWNAAANQRVFETRLTELENPGLDDRFDNGKTDAENANGYQPSHFAANSYVLNVNGGPSIEEISDGISNTLFAGEVKSGIKAWGDPTNIRDPTLGVNQSRHGFGGPYRGGAHFLFGDGRARFVSENIDPAILKALSTPNGGETVGEF